MSAAMAPASVDPTGEEAEADDPELTQSPRPTPFPASGATSTQPTPAEAARMNEADFEAWRQDFLRGFAEDLAELRRDPEAWAEYQAEGELTSVPDGIG